MGADLDPTKTAADALSKVASEAYTDLVRPGAKHVGAAIETIFKVGLSPVAMLDWGFEQSKQWLREKIEQRLRQIPEDCQVPPPRAITVDAIIRIAASVDTPPIQELYAELLMKAMDRRTAPQVHPAYVGVISQMMPQEALVFISFGKFDSTNIFSEQTNQYTRRAVATIEEQFKAHCEALGLPDAAALAPIWLENLRRLRLVEVLQFSDVDYLHHDYERPSVQMTDSRYLEVTEFGLVLLKMCTPIAAASEA
jgi:Abortive infection alpha